MFEVEGLAAVGFLSAFTRFFSFVENDALAARHRASTFALIEGFGGDDAVDFWADVRSGSGSWAKRV